MLKSEKLLKVQNKLYEQAHSQPCELKFLAIKLGNQKIEGDKLYSHPLMIPLPLRGCDYLENLTGRQKAIITAFHYAYLYKVVARSEVLALTANIAVADKVFSPYSDEWMVLYQETQEEMDHIWSFRHLFNSTLSLSGVQESLNEPSFFSDHDVAGADEQFQDFCKQKTGPIPWWVAWNDDSWQSQTLYYFLHNIKSISENDIKGTTLGALYLFTRYLANVQLKQVESFLFHSPDKFDYEPLAEELTRGHHNDEARHYTTSFDLGLELFNRSDRTGQEMVRFYLKHLVEGHIRSFYMTFYEMIEAGEHGQFSVPYMLGLSALSRSLKHPEFQDDQVDIHALRKGWYQHKLGQAVFPLKEMRWRYVSQQLERVIEALDLSLDSDAMGNRYERFRSSL